MNYAEIMPFYSLTDFNVENEFISTKRKFENLMNNEKFENFLKDNKYEQILNPSNVTPCEYFDEEEFSKKYRKGDECLNIFSLNIRSLPKHGGELFCFLKDLNTKFHIIVLTEIGSKNISVVENLLPNYNFQYVLPEKNKCGGVGIYTCGSLTDVIVKDHVKFVKSCDCTKCETESLFIEFCYRGIAYTVGGIYRHPSGNVSHFISDLEIVLNQVDNDKTTVLTGDINIDIIKFSNEDVVTYMTTLMSYGYLPYITIPSRITYSSMTCIDHIFIRLARREKVLNILSGLFYCDISDHLPCFTSIKHNRTSCIGERPMTRLFGEKNSTSFVQRMEAENWNEIYSEGGDYYTKFITVVLRIFQQSFPVVRVSRKRWRDKPWVTKALKTSIRRKNNLYKASLTHHDNQKNERYKTYKNILRKCLKEAEVKYYEELFDNHKNSVYNIWKTLNPIINPKKGKSFATIKKLIIDQGVAEDKQQISNSMNDHFCNIGSKLKLEIPDYGRQYMDFMPQRIINSFYLEPITADDILLEIKRLKQNKSPGHDLIGSKVIKLCPEIFASNLSKIYNWGIQNGTYPEELKIAKVIALYKKGVKYDPNNYRPISLLSLFDKILEKILCRRLVSFLEHNKILYCYQYGFRKAYSTVLALIEITDYIKRLLDERNYVISIFIDFKKAFDTVDHEILLYKLECYGIRGLANDFFRSYLTNRRQYTVINGVNSELRTVSCGVPQGSVLGPLFFLLYINDLHRSIGDNSVRLYADDTAIITSNPNLESARYQAKESFTKLYHWCVANKLSINSEKTSFVLFHLKNKPIPRNFTCIQTEVMQIDRVESVQYLGMLLDEKLYWHEHVDQICASLVKYFGIFNHIKNFVSKRIARQLYFAFIYSRIQYGIETYGTCAKETLAKVQIMQNKLLKLLLKWDRRTPTDFVHYHLSILKINDMHTAKILSFVNECRSGRVPDIFVNYYKIRETGLNLRDRSSLDIPWARTDMGLSRCDVKGARLWNNNLQAVNPLLHKKSFHKQLSKFLVSRYI